MARQWSVLLERAMRVSPGLPVTSQEKYQTMYLLLKLFLLLKMEILLLPIVTK